MRRTDTFYECHKLVHHPTIQANVTVRRLDWDDAVQSLDGDAVNTAADKPASRGSPPAAAGPPDMAFDAQFQV